MGLSFMVGICFIWIGFVAAISFMESWLKFRAPGVELAAGLSIGRLVFKVLNIIEWICFVLIVINGFVSNSFSNGTDPLLGFCVALAIILIIETLVLLPRMDSRALKVMGGEKVTKSKLHIYYVGLELIKMVLLISSGVILLGLVV